MTEVVFNIAGMRLPVVMTLANRGVSAPITIWNDHQDAMTVRDAGWIMLFAEDHQEAVAQHILAYKIAEQAKLPVMVNVDGFVLTHTYDSVVIPETAKLKKYLPDYKPTPGEYLDVAQPITMGAFTMPAYYLEIREKLHRDLLASLKLIKTEYDQLKKIIPEAIKPTEKNSIVNNGLIEYYGAKNPNTIIVAMGSVVGTIKDVVDETKGVGVLKIKSFRPFPAVDILNILKKTKYVAVVEKAISLGANDGPLTMEIKSLVQNKLKNKIQGFIVGLGGRDITGGMIKNIIKEVQKKDGGLKFVNK
jgi:pyruvate ferredoxin oxidoreductase alpha subunit